MLETTHQVGRISVSTADMPYKEMAGHCEALLVGKQKKMSHLMSAQLRQESLINFSITNHENEVNEVLPSRVDAGSLMVLPCSSKPFSCAHSCLIRSLTHLFVQLKYPY